VKQREGHEGKEPRVEQAHARAAKWKQHRRQHPADHGARGAHEQLGHDACGVGSVMPEVARHTGG